MKRLKILWVLIICAQSAFAQQNEGDFVNRLHKNKFTWMLNHTEDSLMTLFHDSLKYIHSNGWTQNKNELVDGLKTGKLVYSEIEVLSSSVALYGSTAIVTGKGYFKGVLSGKTEFSMQLLYTEVYIKVQNSWKLVNRHACKL